MFYRSVNDLRLHSNFPAPTTSGFCQTASDAGKSTGSPHFQAAECDRCVDVKGSLRISASENLPVRKESSIPCESPHCDLNAVVLDKDRCIAEGLIEAVPEEKLQTALANLPAELQAPDIPHKSLLQWAWFVQVENNQTTWLLEVHQQLAQMPREPNDEVSLLLERGFR